MILGFRTVSGRGVVAGLIGLCLTCSMNGAAGASEEDAIAREWRVAAENREREAGVLREQAEELVDCAQDWREREVLYAVEREQNYARSGDAEMRAGSLFAAAHTSFKRAAQHWNKSAAANDDSEAGERYREHALEKAGLAERLSKEMAAEAVAAYGRAVERYAPEAGNRPEKAAEASRRRAEWATQD